MNRVRVKDLALVAAAGGLLAFELVSIGEALPSVKKALAERAWPERVEVASASAVAVPLPALEAPTPKVAQAGSKDATRHAYVITTSTSAASAKRCVAMAHAREARRAHERTRIIRVASDGSCAARAAEQVVEKRREIEKAVSLAVKQSTL